MALSKFSLAFRPSMYSYLRFTILKLCACLLLYRRPSMLGNPTVRLLFKHCALT
jgi:hypothetical protein